MPIKFLNSHSAPNPMLLHNNFQHHYSPYCYLVYPKSQNMFDSDISGQLHLSIRMNNHIADNTENHHADYQILQILHLHPIPKMIPLFRSPTKLSLPTSINLVLLSYSMYHLLEYSPNGS